MRHALNRITSFILNPIFCIVLAIVTFNALKNTDRHNNILHEIAKIHVNRMKDGLL